MSADSEAWRVTLACNRIEAELLAYAEVHAKATGLAEPLPPEKIAVPMIERFMATDRAFASERRRR